MSDHACSYCGRHVNPLHPQTFRKITGWERKSQTASRRNGSDIVLREPTNEFACDECIRRLRRGVAPAQGAML